MGGGVGQWRELSGSQCKREWNGAAGASAVFMGQREARACSGATQGRSSTRGRRQRREATRMSSPAGALRDGERCAASIEEKGDGSNATSVEFPRAEK